MTSLTPFTRIVKGTADTVGWDVITAPIVCRAVKIRNKSDVQLLYRTKDTDPNTQDSIPPGGEWDYTQPGPGWGMQTIRIGEIILNVQAESGNVDYTVRFY